MRWDRSYKARFYAMTVNPKTWYDRDRINLTSGSVAKANSGLRNSAEFTAEYEDDFTERLVRIYVDAVQGEEIVHEPIFTGYAINPSTDINGKLKTQKTTCYSVLKPADDVLLPRGWYAGVGSNAIKVIRDLLSVSPAPFEPDPDDDDYKNAPKLTRNILAEDGETRLTMADKIVKAMSGWRLDIKGDGTIVVYQYDNNTTQVFDAEDMDIIEPALKITKDWFNVPNVYRVTMENVSAICRDDNENSPYSTVSRGREVWAEENGAQLTEGESLAQYTKRRLKEAQQVATEVSYTRGFVPDIDIGDVIRLRYEEVQGKFRVTSQNIELSHAIRTSEQAERIDYDIESKPVQYRTVPIMPDDFVLVMPNGEIVMIPEKRDEDDV